MPCLKLSRVLFMGTMMVAMQSCSYSIRITNKNGTAQDSPTNHELGFYNGKQVHTIDTVVKLSLLQDGVMVIDSACAAGGFHSVEYKITFGAMLRNTFTFGKRKSIKVKCTCLANSN